jgi:hypothetical protein
MGKKTMGPSSQRQQQYSLFLKNRNFAQAKVRKTARGWKAKTIIFRECLQQPDLLCSLPGVMSTRAPPRSLIECLQSKKNSSTILKHSCRSGLPEFFGHNIPKSWKNIT